MNRLVPLALFVVVLTSGCTVPILGIDIPIPFLGGDVVEQDVNDVIVIRSLEAIPNEVDSGGVSRIVAGIENVGNRIIGGEEGVRVELFDYCEGLFTPKVIACPGGSVEGRAERQMILGEQESTVCILDKILPGEIVPVMWTVCQNRADPVKVRTVCPENGMKVLVRYKYDTNSVTTVSLISLSEMQRQMIERTYRPTNSYISVGTGPIKPYLTVEDMQPVPVFDIMPGHEITDPEGRVTSGTDPNVLNARTVLKLQLKNLGSGQLDTKVRGEGYSQPVIGILGSQIEVIGIGEPGDDLQPVKAEGDDITCIFDPGDAGIGPQSSENWNNKVIRFVGDESSPFHCQIDLSPLRGQVSMETTRLLRVNVKDYDYVITKSVLLTVNPKIAA
ncbi:MAG: hypothetical protein JSV63_00620 [Candidatus Aenigmatarchaeota archaeon]|nr:MAG: hypothetical protein JSV63_00620 [Candidatus Aenigmarchaeota archaeon]